MDANTLENANSLARTKQEFDQALNCFEWMPTDDSEPITLNPRLIIEFDGDGREQVKLPMNLSNAMVSFLKREIIKGQAAAIAEFKEL